MTDRPDSSPTAPGAGPAIVTGFHRSGTSLAAEWLASAGLFMGWDMLAGGVTPSGERAGHHEDLDFIELHANALKRRGLGLFVTDPSVLPLEFTDDEARLVHEAVARRASVGPWGFKDPRASLFVDSWAHLAPNALFVLIVRPPREALDSLLRRGRDKRIKRDPTTGILSWIVYNESLRRLLSAQPDRCLAVPIHESTDDAVPLPTLVGRKLGVELESVPIDEIRDSVLLRTEYGDGVRRAEEKNPDVFARADDLYRLLVSEAAE